MGAPVVKWLLAGAGARCVSCCPGGVPRPLVAVELDLPEGPDMQRGGTWIDGQQYFRPSREDAAVVWKAPQEVVCGDFPELDPFAGLDDSDDDGPCEPSVQEG